MGFVSPVPIHVHCLLPFLRTTLLSCSPMETAGKNLYQLPSVTLFRACWAQGENPSAPAGKPQNIPQCFLHPPALHRYGTASVAPRSVMLQLLTTSLNLTQKMTPSSSLVFPRWQQAILAPPEGTENCPQLQTPQKLPVLRKTNRKISEYRIGD